MPWPGRNNLRAIAYPLPPKSTKPIAMITTPSSLAKEFEQFMRDRLGLFLG